MCFVMAHAHIYSCVLRDRPRPCSQVGELVDELRYQQTLPEERRESEVAAE